jgi:hypothetical protein
MDENNGGIHPWSVEGDYESHLLLFNHSKMPQVFGVGISSGTTLWDKKYTLAPNETREISINELIQDKVPDEKGRILGPSLQRGTVNWMVPDSGNATGRLMVTSRSGGMARNFSCGNFVVVCGFYFDTYDNGLIPVGTNGDLWSGNPEFCSAWGPGQCSGGNQLGYGSASYSWTIGATSIIKATSSSQLTVQSPQVTGVAGGNGSGVAEAEAGGCGCEGSGPGDVQVPTSTTIFSTEVDSARSCPAGYAGWTRNPSQEVLDQNGEVIILAFQQTTESYTINSNANGLLMSSIATGNGSTNEAGIYSDSYWVCSDKCPSSKTTSATQQPYDKLPTSSVNYTLQPNAVLYSCNSITVNGK